MDGPGPLFGRDAERVAHEGRYRRGGDDLACHLRQRSHRGDDVDDLKSRLARALDRLLPCDHQHRHGAEVSICRAGREVQGSGSQGR